MTVADSLMTVTLRAVGRLLVAGAITHDVAAAMVRTTWARQSFALMPSGSTSTTEGRATMAAAAGNDWWCRCGYYRASCSGGLCPSCADDERRGVA